MTGTTLELIFSGLLLLSLPEGDGKAIVAFPDDDGHQMNLVLIKGHLGEGCDSWDSEDGLPVLRFSERPELRGRSMAIEQLGGVRGLRWMNGSLPEAPESRLESSLLNWAPSLSTMVWGQSRLRERCRERNGDCRWAEARFFLDRGEISTCHLVHPVDEAMSGCPDEESDQDESKSTLIPVRMYDLPGGGQHALADAIAVRHSLVQEDSAVVLGIGEHNCELKSEDDRITLFIANAPLVRHTQNHDGPASHFQLLHQFSANFFQRMDRSQPSPLNLYKRINSRLLSCENAIRCAHEAINRRSPIDLQYAHSPTECGTASQP